MQRLEETISIERSVPLRILVGLLIVVAIAGATHAAGFMGVFLAAVLPFGIAVLILFHARPDTILLCALAVGFVAAGLGRYVSFPVGLLLDAVLAVGLLIAVIRKSEKRTVSRWLLLLILGWMGLSLLQLLNPLAASRIAWFYAMRGVALYPVLIVLIGYLLSPEQRFFETFIKVWAGLSIVATLWGMKQLWIGLDPWEAQWLSDPSNNSTHLLFGKLRVFSFMSDAGQFGAAQGHTAVLAAIMGLSSKKRVSMMIWFAIAALSMVGLLISGTRGALAVPAFGGLAYILLCKNWRLILLGLLVAGASYGTLRYTYIGQDIYEVRRMRGAIIQGSDNASFQVRLENQKLLASYLRDKPFGGGIGSAGYWGQRFSPGTFLAELALDSWYVKIWAEYGPVGLAFYLAMLAAMLAISIRFTLLDTNQRSRTMRLAMLSGLIGILVASYGNQVFGQIPTGVIIPVSLLFLLSPPRIRHRP